MTFSLILKILHIATAAAWFGLMLSVPGKIRRGLALGGEAAKFAVSEAVRTQKLGLMMGGATLIFGIALVLALGGFGAQPKSIHISLGVTLLMLAFSFFVTRGACAGLSAALSSGDAAVQASTRKGLTMACGIEQVLWIGILVLMVERF